MRTATVAEQIQVFFTSQTKAQFSVLVCNRTQLASCESLGMHHSVSVVCIYYFLNTLRLFNRSNCIHLFIILFIALQLESINKPMYILEQLLELFKSCSSNSDLTLKQEINILKSNESHQRKRLLSGTLIFF